MLFVPYPDNFSAYWMWSVPLRSWCNFVRNDGGIIYSAHAQTAHSLNYGYNWKNNEHYQCQCERSEIVQHILKLRIILPRSE